MRRPSGLNATPSDVAGVSLERERLLAGAGVPDLDRLIVAGRGDAASVGAERHAIDGAGVSLERERLLAGAGVPDLDRLIAAGRGDASTVGAERHAMTASVCPLSVLKSEWQSRLR